MNSQRKESYSFRMTPEEKKIFSKIAEEKGISLSEFIRESTLEAVEDFIDYEGAKKLMERVEAGKEEVYDISTLDKML